MPRRVSCVCGYQWCDAREVCSWAWRNVDATEGAYHVKVGTTGADPFTEHNRFQRARAARESRVQARFTTVEDVVAQRDVWPRGDYVVVNRPEFLVQEWQRLAERPRIALNDPF